MDDYSSLVRSFDCIVLEQARWAVVKLVKMKGRHMDWPQLPRLSSKSAWNQPLWEPGMDIEYGDEVSAKYITSRVLFNRKQYNLCLPFAVTMQLFASSSETITN